MKIQVYCNKWINIKTYNSKYAIKHRLFLKIITVQCFKYLFIVLDWTCMFHQIRSVVIITWLQHTSPRASGQWRDSGLGNVLVRTNTSLAIVHKKVTTNWWESAWTTGESIVVFTSDYLALHINFIECT